MVLDVDVLAPLMVHRILHQCDAALVVEAQRQHPHVALFHTKHPSRSLANILQTIGTNTVDGAITVEEHGLFSQAATGGGTLWDRTTFAVINLAIGDSLQSTYEATLNSGG